MPKHYSMGGRATGSAGAGGAPGAPAPRSMRERFMALRNLPPFLRMIWQVSRGLTVADLLLRLVRALRPVA